MQVQGFVEDCEGAKVAALRGKWDDSMYYTEGDAMFRTNDSRSPENTSLLWRRSKPPDNPTRYNLSSFAITLNELTPELQVEMAYFLLTSFYFFFTLILLYLLSSSDPEYLIRIKEKLPPTDSRLRPDQRHLENGEYEKANAEKQRLERRQRMVCL